MEGAEIIDPAAWFLPRANLAPYARFRLGDGKYVKIFSNCYPLKENGYRACSLKLLFSIPAGNEISFADMPIVMKSPDGEDLVNVELYEKFAGRLPNTVRDGKVFVEFSGSMRFASVSLSAKSGYAYTAKIPDIIVEGKRIAVPEIKFTRVDNLTCVGFFSNF
ncbi:hypothetical protein SAMN05444000_1524 [Shimia gijangensis]|uniref:Uncharacterized protein n=1 Tax=Shimia gijangensis TaxID=1470563 RepID=A0A1M6U4Z6_9RHOB|nr:hypothetical protein [Shimia gijangensis]SHK64240.1 hypothetical protein SAMN05444000_1524 [Shimia gijangensis]